jgi:excisionase family DNA binding protein
MTIMQEWLTAHEAAEYARCSPATIYTLVKAGKLKVARLTGHQGGMRFRREWIDHWLEKSAKDHKFAVNQ